MTSSKIASGQALSKIAVSAANVLSRAIISHVVFGTGANATVTTSTTVMTMMGYGAAGFSYTPITTGNLRVIISAVYGNATTDLTLVGTSGYAQLVYGTSTAPNSGDAFPGSPNYVGGGHSIAMRYPYVPIADDTTITGLAVGTAYWFDYGCQSVSATHGSNVTDIHIIIYEY